MWRCIMLLHLCKQPNYNWSVDTRRLIQTYCWTPEYYAPVCVCVCVCVHTQVFMQICLNVCVYECVFITTWTRCHFPEPRCPGSHECRMQASWCSASIWSLYTPCACVCEEKWPCLCSRAELRRCNISGFHFDLVESYIMQEQTDHSQDTVSLTGRLSGFFYPIHLSMDSVIKIRLLRVVGTLEANIPLMQQHTSDTNLSL